MGGQYDRSRGAVCALVMVLLAGCGSSPSIHFYTLDPVPAEARANKAPSLTVQIAAVHIPATLDRREMVRETASNSLDVNGQNEWAAPVDEMIRRVLSQDLVQRLPKGAVLAPDEPATASAMRIVVAVSQFERNPSGVVVLDGSWSSFPAGGKSPEPVHDFHLQQRPSGNSYADDAACMSSLVGLLANNIASVLQES